LNKESVQVSNNKTIEIIEEFKLKPQIEKKNESIPNKLQEENTGFCP
jgi:hypothetical protein